MSPIRLDPPEKPTPRSACIPLKHALRWLAPFDHVASHPGGALQTDVSHPDAAPQPGGALQSGGAPQPGGLSTPGVSVFVSPKAFLRVNAHARSDLDHEVGGWLVGKWRRDKHHDRQYIVVENNLPAPYTRQGRAFLTFTQDTQVALRNLFDERFPGKDLVGWYHTHPRMGVFLSSYDTWLHKNFFPEHYQVAMVLEPHTSAGGFFIRTADGGLDAQRYFGFYELINSRRGSVVHWHNVIPAPESIHHE